MDGDYLIGLIVVGAVIGVGVLVLLAKPEWISKIDLAGITDAKERHDVKTANRDLVLKFIGGLGLVGALVVSGLAYQETQKTSRVAQDTLNVTQQSQAADRFNKAVEQIESSSEAVRIGGIATLRSLLSNVEQHAAAVDVLAAFVRSNAKPPAAVPKLVLPFNPCRDRSPVQPPLDIQAAMAALASRDSSGEKTPLDLRYSYLAGLELTVGRNLNGALLDYSDLSYAKLVAVDLIGVKLRHVKASYSCFVTANMREATTDYVSLEHAVLSGVESVGTEYNCADLSGANLAGVDLAGTILRGTNLQGAFLSELHLEHGGLDRVDVTGAIFGGAHLQGTNLRFANGLTNEQIQSAGIDKDTALPVRTEPWPPNCDVGGS